MPQAVLLAPLVALIFGAVTLGGGIYETLVVDRAWPGNPALIQPSRGGLSRARFWVPAHSLFEVALLVSAWVTWGEPAARPWVVAALCAHFGSRVWSFAYFIPRAMRFEKMGELSQEQLGMARRWIGLSRCRPVLELVAIVALGGTVVQVAAGDTHAGTATRATLIDGAAPRAVAESRASRSLAACGESCTSVGRRTEGRGNRVGDHR